MCSTIPPDSTIIRTATTSRIRAPTCRRCACAFRCRTTSWTPAATTDRDYYDFLREPPVEPVERVYSLNEVKYSARIRDKVRRIDLDTVTFATAALKSR
jgi:hypothetical protein